MERRMITPPFRKRRRVFILKSWKFSGLRKEPLKERMQREDVSNYRVYFTMSCKRSMELRIKPRSFKQPLGLLPQTPPQPSHPPILRHLRMVVPPFDR